MITTETVTFYVTSAGNRFESADDAKRSEIADGFRKLIGDTTLSELSIDTVAKVFAGRSVADSKAAAALQDTIAAAVAVQEIKP